MSENIPLPPEPVVVLVTCESVEQARAIAGALLEGRMAACANLIPAVESHYWWKGNLETSAETLMMIKTLASRVEEVRRVVEELHSYEVFELVVIPIAGGSKEYLEWIVSEASGSGAGEP